MERFHEFVHIREVNGLPDTLLNATPGRKCAQCPANEAHNKPCSLAVQQYVRLIKNTAELDFIAPAIVEHLAGSCMQTLTLYGFERHVVRSLVSPGLMP